MTIEETKGLSDRQPDDVRPDEPGLETGAPTPLVAAIPNGMAEGLADAAGPILWAGYGRSATQDCNGEDGLDRQFAACAPLWMRDGNALHAWVTDSGRSGLTMDDRDGLRRVFAAARRREFHRLAVEDVGRISRDPGQLTAVIDELTGLGVELWSPDLGRLDVTRGLVRLRLGGFATPRLLEATGSPRRPGLWERLARRLRLIR